MKNRKFNIRVYGIYINETKEVLVADEYRFNTKFTKFPGGGLEQGEGTIECLKREWEEELNTQIEILEHFYTTDYYQPSAFDETEQLISIYYLVKPVTEIQIQLSSKPFDFELKEEVQNFRFIPLSEISSDDFKFPVDKKVAEMLQEKNFIH